jgi:hypothetical protein
MCLEAATAAAARQIPVIKGAIKDGIKGQEI